MPITPITPSGSNAPNDLPSDAAGAVAVPNTLPSDAAGAVAVPNTLPADGAGSVASPVSLPSVAAAAAPRTLTPMVNLDFAAKSYARKGRTVLFDDLLTYTRPSSATFINRRPDVDGGYEYFLDTDYVGNVTNLATYSEDFSDADWVKSGAITVSSKDTLAPDGTKTADKVVFAANALSLYQLTTLATGVSVTGTLWIKGVAGETITYTSTGNATGINTYSGATARTVYIWGAQLTASAKPLPYVKTLASAVTQTFTETLRTEYDAVTGENLGALIEGGSTNLAVYSEDFANAAWVKNEISVSENAIQAPDSTLSADSLAATATSTLGLSFVDSNTSTAGTTYTHSVYAKKGSIDVLQIFFGNNAVSGNPRVNFDLTNGVVGTQDVAIINATITPVGGGWYRCACVVIANTTSTQRYFALVSSPTSVRAEARANTAGDNCYIWGAQAEAQPFATSYIRTEGSAVSRSPDFLSVGADNISAANTDFTISIDLEVKDVGPSGFPGVFHVIGESTRRSAFSGSTKKLTTTVGGTNITSDALTYPLNIKYSVTRNNEFSTAYIDNNQIGQVATTSISGVKTSIEIGKQSSNYLNGHISKFKTYAQALTAQEITLL